MNVFITGATGFIGRKLIEIVANDTRFNKIYCLCRKEECFPSKANIVMGSLEDLHNIPAVDADICLHLAAITDSTTYDKRDIFKTNADGTDNVIEFCKRSGIAKIVFLSSVNVYLKKMHSYALSKVYAEEHIKNSGLKYTILRCSLVYGPNCPSFEKIIRYAELFHIIPVLGKGSSYKQPIYIDEVCNEIIKCTFSSIDNAVYDVYGKTKMTYNEMVRSIADANNKKALILHLPVTPILLVSKFCYKRNLPFPLYPEQISHMCENLCSTAEFDDSCLDDFINNLHKYIK